MAEILRDVALSTSNRPGHGCDLHFASPSYLDYLDIIEFESSILKQHEESHHPTPF